MYAAYDAATRTKDVPTVILAKTIKGWLLGPGIQGGNTTHQVKKLTTDQLKALRNALHLQDEISDEVLESGEMPYYRPPVDSPEVQYLLQRRKALDGTIPASHRREPPPHRDARRRRVPGVRRRVGRPPRCPRPGPSPGCCARSPGTRRSGQRIVPIIPDEGRTFGMDALFKELKIYASKGQLYEPVDHHLILSYKEGKDGQILEEGITEAGALSSWIAAATSYATRGVPMVPFYTFYSMFGFQRVGDLLWGAADARCPRVPPRRNGRAHHPARRRPPAPGRPQPRARVDSAGVPAPTTRPSPTRWRRSSAPACTACTWTARTSTTTSRSTTRPTPSRRSPHGSDDGIVAGMYLFEPAPDGTVAARRDRVLRSGARGSPGGPR